MAAVCGDVETVQLDRDPRMRIALVIDSLNSGGAQRQMAMLALLLKGADHDVTLFCYRDRAFFRPMLERAEIPVVNTAPGRLSRILDMRRKVRGARPDVAIAFLPTPNLLLELAGLPRREFGIIASERNSRIGSLSLRDRFSLNLHRVADAVVTNSHDAAAGITSVVPQLGDKMHVITNCVDLDEFSYSAAPPHRKTAVLSVLARFHENKNALGLADALKRVVDQQPLHDDFVIHWYGNSFYREGRPTHLSKNYQEVKQRIHQLGLDSRIVLHPPAQDVVSIYRESDAIVLPSFVEGCSNVICEALASGRPVLTSNVCDNPRWVTDGENGFLFDPYDSSSIANAIQRFMSLDRAARVEMGRKGRVRAENELSEAVFLDRYTNVINQVVSKY